MPANVRTIKMQAVVVEVAIIEKRVVVLDEVAAVGTLGAVDIELTAVEEEVSDEVEARAIVVTEPVIWRGIVDNQKIHAIVAI